MTTGVHRSVIEGHDPNDAEHHARSALGGAQFAAAAELGHRTSIGDLVTLACSPTA
jgi:hypothetical protein